MSRKKFKHQRLQLCRKYENAELAAQYAKVFEEMGEMVEAYANYAYAKERGELDRHLVKALADEVVDVSKASQLFIRILINTEGRQMALSEDEIYGDNDRKNERRGYHKPVEADINSDVVGGNFYMSRFMNQE